MQTQNLNEMHQKEKMKANATNSRMNSTALHTRRKESKRQKLLNELHQKEQIVANAKNSRNSTSRNESKRYEPSRYKLIYAITCMYIRARVIVN